MINFTRRISNEVAFLGFGYDDVTVSGNTNGMKDSLKGLGFKWNGSQWSYKARHQADGIAKAQEIKDSDLDIVCNITEVAGMLK